MRTAAEKRAALDRHGEEIERAREAILLWERELRALDQGADALNALPDQRWQLSGERGGPKLRALMNRWHLVKLDYEIANGNFDRIFYSLTPRQKQGDWT